jgi:hypothetical protein
MRPRLGNVLVTSWQVPGSAAFAAKGSDPYVDFVQLAADLGCSGAPPPRGSLCTAPSGGVAPAPPSRQAWTSTTRRCGASDEIRTRLEPLRHLNQETDSSHLPAGTPTPSAPAPTPARGKTIRRRTSARPPDVPSTFRVWMSLQIRLLPHGCRARYAAILKDTIDAIDAIQPSLGLSTAAAAAGAWDGKWWGGNLKGVWLEARQLWPARPRYAGVGARGGGDGGRGDDETHWALRRNRALLMSASGPRKPARPIHRRRPRAPSSSPRRRACHQPIVWAVPSQVSKKWPSLLARASSTGGVNVMTYDVSDNQAFHECPDDAHCKLDQQVSFYMDTFKTASIGAAVGYEVGTPACTPPTAEPAPARATLPDAARSAQTLTRRTTRRTSCRSRRRRSPPSRAAHRRAVGHRSTRGRLFWSHPGSLRTGELLGRVPLGGAARAPNHRGARVRREC